MSRISTTALVLSFLSLSATAQLAGQTVRIQTILTGGADGTSGDCLTATQNVDGAAVIITSCGNNATQLNSWVSPNGVGVAGPLQIFGDKCLDVQDGVNADGTQLQISSCTDGDTNQLWVPGGTQNQIVWSGNDKCVDVPNGNTTSGNIIEILTCAPGDADVNQRFAIAAVTQPKTRTIKSKVDTTKCVTAINLAVNASVVIAPCIENVPEQAWYAPVANRLAIDGPGVNNSIPLCITPAGDQFTTDGAKLILDVCELANPGLRGDQSWGFGSQGSVISNGGYAKMVMDLTNGSTNTGNQLQLWFGDIFSGAGDNVNQDWYQTYKF